MPAIQVTKDCRARGVGPAFPAASAIVILAKDRRGAVAMATTIRYVKVGADGRHEVQTRRTLAMRSENGRVAAETGLPGLRKGQMQVCQACRIFVGVMAGVSGATETATCLPPGKSATESNAITGCTGLVVVATGVPAMPHANDINSARLGNQCLCLMFGACFHAPYYVNIYPP